MNDSSDGFSGLSRARLPRAFRRWAALIALATALGAGAALAISVALPSEYRATAQLYLAPTDNPTAALQDVVLGQNLARSYVQLAQSEVVLRRAREKVSWQDSKSFRERTQVAQVRDTSVITISFRDRDPERAAQIANLIADSFIDQSRALQSSLQSTTVTQLDEDIRTVGADIENTDSELSRLRTALAALPAAPQPPRTELQTQITRLESRQTTRQQTLAQLLKTRDDLRLAAARAETTVTVWERAAPPTEAESPRVALNTVAGAFTGALLALVGVALFIYMDDRIGNIDEVRARLGAPALGEIVLASEGMLGPHGLFVRDAPASPAAEAFRAIRTNLMLTAVDRPPRTILVTSALTGEGKSVVSANLALAFAESGTLTVLVDADLRRPHLHRLFGLDSASGLTDIVGGTRPPSDIRKFEVMPNLIVIPSGHVPLNPAELLSSERMSSLIANLSHLAESAMVVIDTSPILAVADALALSTKVDGCVVVVDSARARARASRRAIESLAAVHATIFGVVLNKAAPESGYYEGYP